MTEIYTIKHVADHVANEPRNVGVIAANGRTADADVALRFLGIDLNGSVSHRPYPAVSKDVYLAWVAYFRRKTRNGQWDDIARSAAHRPQDFYLDLALTLTTTTDAHRAADEYFTKLVAQPNDHRSRSELMRAQVDEVFSALSLVPERDVKRTAEINHEPIDISFGYYLDGDTPLYMDQMPIRGISQAGQAFAWRASMMGTVDETAQFAAFVDLESGPDESILRTIESVAVVVDPVSNYDQAVETVAELMKVRSTRMPVAARL